MDEFKEFIEAAPQRITEYDFETKEWNVSYIDSITTQDALKSLRATQQNRLEEFVRYLYTLPHDNWGTVLKMVTENLIYSYGDTKMAVPKRPSKDIHNIGEVRRSLMLVLYELVGHVTTVASRLNISYPDYFIKNIEKQFGEFCLLPDLMRYKDSEQPSHAQIQDILLPEKLNTPRARKYFSKAIDANIITKTDTGYSMGSAIKTKALLAYFIELVFCRDEAGKDNGIKYPGDASSLLFGTTRLEKARSQYLNNKGKNPKGQGADYDGGKPGGYKIIDKIFM